MSFQKYVWDGRFYRIDDYAVLRYLRSIQARLVRRPLRTRSAPAPFLARGLGRRTSVWGQAFVLSIQLAREEPVSLRETSSQENYADFQQMESPKLIIT